MAGAPFRCNRHDVEWWGHNICHCETCGLLFSGVTAFDKHRENGACVNPALSKRFWMPRVGVWSYLTLKDAEKASVIPAKGHPR